jgi:hypothetical protein
LEVELISREYQQTANQFQHQPMSLEEDPYYDDVYDDFDGSDDDGAYLDEAEATRK